MASLYWIDPQLSKHNIKGINSQTPKQNGWHIADHILKCIFLRENWWLSQHWIGWWLGTKQARSHYLNLTTQFIDVCHQAIVSGKSFLPVWHQAITWTNVDVHGIFNWTLKNKVPWNLKLNLKLFIHENASELWTCLQTVSHFFRFNGLMQKTSVTSVHEYSLLGFVSVLHQPTDTRDIQLAICIDELVQKKTLLTPLLTHWCYVFLALTHWYIPE